jgi:predicted small metal-binding protein
MTCTFACRSLGLNCSHVAEGKSMEELMKKVAQHGKKVHGYTDAQLQDPALSRKVQTTLKCL